VQKFLEKMCRKPWLLPLLCHQTCSKAENSCLESRFFFQVGVTHLYHVVKYIIELNSLVFSLALFKYLCFTNYIINFKNLFLLYRYSGKTQKQIVEFVRENYVKRQTFQR
jgi:hypothetical protein